MVTCLAPARAPRDGRGPSPWIYIQQRQEGIGRADRTAWPPAGRLPVNPSGRPRPVCGLRLRPPPRLEHVTLGTRRHSCSPRASGRVVLWTHVEFTGDDREHAGCLGLSAPTVPFKQHRVDILAGADQDAAPVGVRTKIDGRASSLHRASAALDEDHFRAGDGHHTRVAAMAQVQMTSGKPQRRVLFYVSGLTARELHVKRRTLRAERGVVMYPAEVVSNVRFQRETVRAGAQGGDDGGAREKA